MKIENKILPSIVNGYVIDQVANFSLAYAKVSYLINHPLFYVIVLFESTLYFGRGR